MKHSAPYTLALVGLVAASLMQGCSKGALDHEGYRAARARAEAESKCMLLAFTGSDWCDWCIKLEAEVFSRPVFRNFAESNLVMLVIDFPSDESAKTLAARKQDSALADYFGVNGFPTVLIICPEGNAVARTGYKDGGPKAYVEHVKQLMAKAR
jgi:thioredoxin-related protein